MTAEIDLDSERSNYSVALHVRITAVRKKDPKTIIKYHGDIVSIMEIREAEETARMAASVQRGKYLYDT